MNDHGKFPLLCSVVFLVVANLGYAGGGPMKVVRAQSPDGRIYRAANTGYHVTSVGKAANTAYRQMMIFGEGGGVAGKIERPYERSAWVMRAIKLIAQPVASLPLEFYLDRRGGDNLLTGGDAVAFWDRPFAGMSRVDGMEATISWLKLAGNAFWLRDDTWFNGARTKSPLIVARPDRMRPEVIEGELVGWHFRDGAGRSRFLPLPYVEHLKNWNPYDEIWGLGEWEAARIATESDYFAGSYARNLMASSGDQGDIVVAKGGMPTDVQREQIIQQLTARKRARERGKYIPVFLTGDVSVEKADVSAPDAAFVANRLENRHEIFIAFGVPPSMADVKASYSIGADSDYARLIEGTCMPAGAKICEAVENISLRLEPRRLFVEFSWRDNSVVQAVRRERFDAATKLWGTGMSWETINGVLDLGLAPFPGWDKAYIPFSLSEVGAPGLEADPALAEQTQDGEDLAEQLDKIYRARGKRGKTSNAERRTLGAEVKVCGCGAHPLLETKGTSKWASHMAARRGTMKVYVAKFNRELMKARAEVLAKIEKAARVEMAKRLEQPGYRVKATAVDFLFDLTRWKGGFLAEMRKAGMEALKTAGLQFFAEIGKDDPFTMPPARALTFLAKRENLLSECADDVFDRVQSALQDGLIEGESMSDLADRVRAEFNGISKGRATTIASTETGAAYGVARDEGMKQAGIAFKEWLTSGNENVRDSHRQVNGQVVRIDEPFIVGGAELMFPGDPMGPPEEIINCHCVQLAAVEMPEEEA